MEKAIAVVLTMFAVLVMLYVSPIAAEKPLVMPKIRLAPTYTTKGDEQSINCPDGETCPDYDTCCLGTNGAYFCCATANGNCCDNYTTCCASGYVCDDANDKCLKPGLPEDILDKLQFLKK